MNVKIETLPQVSVLSGDDVFVLNKADSFTAKVTVDSLKEHILSEVREDLVYRGDETTIGLTTDNKFYIKDGGVGLNKLEADIQEYLRRIVTPTSPPPGTTLTGTLTTFSSPVTATGEFIIVQVGTQYRAIRAWGF